MVDSARHRRQDSERDRSAPTDARRPASQKSHRSQREPTCASEGAVLSRTDIDHAPAELDDDECRQESKARPSESCAEDSLALSDGGHGPEETPSLEDTQMRSLTDEEPARETSETASSDARIAATKAHASLARSMSMKSEQETTPKRETERDAAQSSHTSSQATVGAQKGQSRQGIIQTSWSRLTGSTVTTPGPAPEVPNPPPRLANQSRDTALTQLRADLDRYKSAYETQLHDIAALNKQNSNLGQGQTEQKARMQRLEAENRDYRHQIALYQQEIDELQHGTARMKTSVQEWKRSMNTQELFLGPQADDTAVVAKFEPLLLRIKTWSVNFLDGNLEPANLPEDDRECLYIVPSCANLAEVQATVLSKQRHKRNFVRGWATYVMATMLFRTLRTPEQPSNGLEDYWLPHEVAKAFRKVEDAMQFSDTGLVGLQEFNNWRALTAMLLTKAIRPDLDPKLPARNINPELRVNANNIVENAAQKVMTVIQPWMKKNANSDALKATLVGIFQQAVECSHALRKHRALWSVHFPAAEKAKTEYGRHGQDLQALKFDSRFMKDQDGRDFGQVTRIPEVKIVVGPALFKRGNLEGERYEEVFTVHFAEVSV